MAGIKMSHSGITKHAKKRIGERTSLTDEQVLDILNGGGAVSLGSKPGINKCHDLFYSSLDKKHLVCIRDSIDGSLLTVLPIEYHANTAWVVTEEQKLTALKLGRRVDSIIGLPPLFAHVGVAVKDRPNSNNVCSKTLSYLPVIDYSIDADAILSKLDNVEIANMAFNKGILATDICSVFVKIGNSALPKYIPFPFDDDSSFKYFSKML